LSTGKRKEFRCFAAKLQELRTASKAKQRDIAKAVGVSQPTVRAWLAGTSGPSIGHLIQLADFFRLPTVDELIRPMPHGGESCLVPKRLLQEMLCGAEDTSRKIQQVLQEAGAVKKPTRNPATKAGRQKSGRQP